MFSRRVPGPLDLDVIIVVRMDGAEWWWLAKLLTKHAISLTRKTIPDGRSKRSATIVLARHKSFIEVIRRLLALSNLSASERLCQHRHPCLQFASILAGFFSCAQFGKA